MGGPAEHIEAVEAFPLNVPLLAPFTIASARLEQVTNVAVCVRLAGGAAGWGEIPSLPPVTVADQTTALHAVAAVAERLRGRDGAAWMTLAADLEAAIPDLPTVRSGIEMVAVDALARQCRVPLYQFFGGSQERLETDITIPICPPDEARRLAARYRKQGFAVIKSKVGLDHAAADARLQAIRGGHPTCQLLLDANEGYDAPTALRLIRLLRSEGIEPVLFEQPVPREDWEGLGRVAREAGVPVAADESCRSPQDALRIAREGLAQVLNIKLAKLWRAGRSGDRDDRPRRRALPDDRWHGRNTARHRVCGSPRGWPGRLLVGRPRYTAAARRRSGLRRIPGSGAQLHGRDR